MDEDQHRKEIESLIPLITKRINHYEQDGLSMSFGSAEQYVMAREIIRLREELEERDQKINRLRGLITNAQDGIGSASSYLSSAKQLIEYGHL